MNRPRTRTSRTIVKPVSFGWAVVLIWLGILPPPNQCEGQEPIRARSDSNARYLHHIDLYDVGNRKITAESTRPYSPRNTCGRCHDYDQISHGWHFNAFDASAKAGRDGEPWIWTDPRTATQLPLAYRDWSHSFDPNEIGLSTWSMTHKFGGRIPGGGIGEAKPDEAGDDAGEGTTPSRWEFSGTLEIDCLACHAVDGVYDMNARREQIEKQNFAFAPTAGLRLGQVDGDVSRIKDGSDPASEAVQSKLPSVQYDSRHFAPGGTVFVDLVRQPTSNACYQCHSQRTVGPGGIEERWIHDEDVHLRAGMDCVDCHRNGIDHDIVRGFEGQVHVDAAAITTLSCRGCHMDGGGVTAGGSDVRDRPGRLGAPIPKHEGLPPVHFEKLSCTACHGGPAPRQEAIRMMTSLAHGLGEKGHRTGQELPAMLAAVYTRREDGRVYPHKAMWPAFWGTLNQDNSITPLDPENVYQWTRRTLRVRKDFVDEVMRPKLKRAELAALLGPDRRDAPEDQRTAAEVARIEATEAQMATAALTEKVSASLRAIEKELPGRTAVYVSAGKAYAAGDEDGTLKDLENVDAKAVGMITWPMAHNVRPAGWSLGTQGCTECHADDGLIFTSTLEAIGPVPGDGRRITMASLQGVDEVERMAWNQMFSGRKTFKYFIATSIAILACVLLVGVLLIGLGMFGYRLTRGQTP